MKIKLKNLGIGKDIKLKREWNWQDLSQMCFNECCCTLPTNKDYNKLRDYVVGHPNPADKDIYKVAKYIKEHWLYKEEPIIDIMNKIANNIVKYIYEVEE